VRPDKRGHNDAEMCCNVATAGVPTDAGHRVLSSAMMQMNDDVVLASHTTALPHSSCKQHVHGCTVTHPLPALRSIALA